MAAPERRTFYDAILAAAATAGFPVGDGKAPTGVTPPYAVIYPLDAADRNGPFNDPEADVIWEFQITSVGETREQAHGVADKVRTVLTPSAISVSGLRVLQVLIDLGDAVERDDDVKPPLFYAVDIYRIWTTPG